MAPTDSVTTVTTGSRACASIQSEKSSADDDDRHGADGHEAHQPRLRGVGEHAAAPPAPWPAGRRRK